MLMDHMMPEMDGIEATEKIRELCPDYKDIPIIALTANAVGSAKEMFMKAGMNDFIAKPIEVRVLISKMKQWLPKEKLKRISVNEKDASQPQEKENPPLLDPNLVDLDTASAIKLVGSEKIFLKILKEYYKLIPSKEASIQAHFDAEDWDSYTVEVHALKSSSKQIGAMQLSDMAAALEKYRAYEQILAPYCKDEETGEGEKPEYESKTVREEFEKIRRAALDLDMDGLEAACKALSGYRYPPEQAEFLTRLIAAADELDMDSCANIVDEWDGILI